MATAAANQIFTKIRNENNKLFLLFMCENTVPQHLNFVQKVEGQLFLKFSHLFLERIQNNHTYKIKPFLMYF